VGTVRPQAADTAPPRRDPTLAAAEFLAELLAEFLALAPLARPGRAAEPRKG
jgi:hypothetical protein